MSWPLIIVLFKAQSYSATQTCILLLGMCKKCQQAGKCCRGFSWLSSYCGAADNQGSWCNTHVSSHLLLCFITSYIRQNKSTKINQHLPIFLASPGTQSIFSLTPEVSLSPNSLREMNLDFYFQNTYPLCSSLDWLQNNRVLMMRLCRSPRQKVRLLGNFSRRVLKGLCWSEQIEQICWDL